MDSYINGLRVVYWKHSKEGQNKAISHVAGLSFREKPHQLYSPEKEDFPSSAFCSYSRKRDTSQQFVESGDLKHQPNLTISIDNT